jgi:hypothetical protein
VKVAEAKTMVAVDPRQQAIAANWPSVNALAAPLVHELILQAKSLRLGVERLVNGCVVVDGGIVCRGGIEAGLRIAEICMGGLGRVSLQPSGLSRWPLQLSVHCANPVLACLGSQYAGWSLSHGEGKGSFQALGSGPGRAAACREELFAELSYRDLSESVCLVLEVDKKPPIEIADKIARDCGVAPDQVTLILTPTRSLAGTVQVVARVLEVHRDDGSQRRGVGHLDEDSAGRHVAGDRERIAVELAPDHDQERLIEAGMDALLHDRDRDRGRSPGRMAILEDMGKVQGFTALH